MAFHAFYISHSHPTSRTKILQNVILVYSRYQTLLWVFSYLHLVLHTDTANFKYSNNIYIYIYIYIYIKVQQTISQVNKETKILFKILFTISIKCIEEKARWNYTWMLWAGSSSSQNCSCSNLPLISKTIQVKQTRHAGYCWRTKDKLPTDILLETPTYRHVSVGQLARTYSHQVDRNRGCSLGELPRAVDDRNRRRERERERERELGKSVSATWW